MRQGSTIATNPNCPTRTPCPPTRRTGSRALFAALLSLAAVPAWADFKEDYALGLHAIDQGDYAAARKYLERALEAQADPVDKIVLNGSVEQPYLPHHFLGIVAYKLGDCDAARAQWNNPVNRRMVGRLTPIVQQEHRLADSCKPQQAESTEKSTSTPAAAASEAAPPVTPTPAPAPAPVAVERRPPAAEPASPRPPSPARPGDGEDRKDAGDRKADAAERSPPPRLVRALDDYLTGRYAEAARIDPEALPQARARFHALLIRAAARYTIAQLGGDKAALAAARADAAAAFRLDPRTAPDEMVFSPAFRSFYAQAH